MFLKRKKNLVLYSLIIFLTIVAIFLGVSSKLGFVIFSDVKLGPVDSSGQVEGESFSVSISTIKKLYNKGEKVELTDPPIGYSLSRNRNLNLDSKNEIEFQKIQNDISEIPIDLYAIEVYEGDLFHEGYIIEFLDKSILERKEELKKTITNPTSLKNMAIKYKKYLDQKHKTDKRSVLSKLKQIRNKAVGEEVVGGDYKLTFNGIGIKDLTDLEALEVGKLPNVKSVTPNYPVFITLNDSVPLINADDVWKLEDSDGNLITGEGISIAIIDTGVDYTHADLGECASTVDINDGSCDKVVGGYDFVNYDSDPMDDHGHGTHVAATAAGDGVLQGVAYGADIYAYKVLSASGSGSFVNIISAIERAVDPNEDGDTEDHVDIISMSLGGGGDPDDPLSVAVDNAVSDEVVVVIAAGNSGPSGNTACRHVQGGASHSICSPGTARKAITVGASNKNDFIAGFSSRGPVTWEDDEGNVLSMAKPDITAPGVSICAAQWEDAFSAAECIDDAHAAISGTSMATPHVAGLAALILQEYPDYTPADVKSVIKNTAVTLASSYTITTEGMGRVEALEAVTLVNPITTYLEPVRKVSGLSFEFSGGIIGDYTDYSLSYAVNNPLDELEETDWTEIESDNIAGSLSADLDTLLFPDSDYIVRLQATNSDGRFFEDYSFFEVKKFEFIEPLSGDVRTPDSDIVIKISNENELDVDEFVLEYSFNKGDWSNDGISTEILTDELTALLAADTISESGYIDFRAIITHNGIDEIILENDVYIEADLIRGFPIFTDQIWTSPTLYDLDKDGDDEIIILTTENLEVYSFENDEITLQWSDEADLISNEPMATTPIVVDWDNDGDMEIIAGGNAWHHDGTVLNGFPVSVDVLGGNILVHTYISDIDADGELEILYETNEDANGLVVLDNNLDEIFIIEYPGDVRPTQTNLLAVDMNEDGYKEIFFKGDIRASDSASGSDEHFLYGYDHLGNPLPGWPIDLEEVFGYEISSSKGKIVSYINDENGEREIIVVMGSLLLTFNLNGFLDWHQSAIGSASNSAIAIGKINDNDSTDLLRGRASLINVGAGAGAGIFLDGFDFSNKIVLPIGCNIQGFFFPPMGSYSEWPEAGVVIANVDGEGDSESIIHDNCGKINIFHSDASYLEGYPKQTGGETYSTPAVGDIDGDGYLEIVTAIFLIPIDEDEEGRIYAWDLSGSAEQKLEWPMYLGDPQHSGCYGWCGLPKSLINNIGDSDADVGVVLKVQKLITKGTSSQWSNVATVVNSNYKIGAGETLALDVEWNEVGGFMPKGGGKYRVVARVTGKREVLETSWEFSVKSESL